MTTNAASQRCLTPIANSDKAAADPSRLFHRVGERRVPESRRLHGECGEERPARRQAQVQADLARRLEPSVVAVTKGNHIIRAEYPGRPASDPAAEATAKSPLERSDEVEL